MKTVLKQHTGIYMRHVSLCETDDDVMSATREALAASDIMSEFRRVARHASAVHRAAGGRRQYRANGEITFCGQPDDATPVARDAGELLEKLHCIQQLLRRPPRRGPGPRDALDVWFVGEDILRKVASAPRRGRAEVRHLNRHELETLMHFCYRVGRLRERMRVRGHEPDALRGVEDRRVKSDAARRANARLAAKSDQVRDRVRAMAKEYGPSYSKKTALVARIVAELQKSGSPIHGETFVWGALNPSKKATSPR